ncbi:MAG: hypothetical protein AAF226_10780 [Verrucomicrobiota bacterium]
MTSLFSRLLFPVLIIALSGSAGCVNLTSSSSEDSGIKIAIGQDSMAINGTPSTLPLQKEALISAFGEPDEVHPLVNTIRVWNDLGIYAYSRPSNSAVHDLSLAFGKENFKFHPKQAFKGRLSVGSTVLRRGQSVKELEAAGFAFDNVVPDMLVKHVGGISVMVSVKGDKMTSASIALPE